MGRLVDLINKRIQDRLYDIPFFKGILFIDNRKEIIRISRIMGISGSKNVFIGVRAVIGTRIIYKKF
jgi:hypothetical protein